ncbi:MAG TPA: tetratricopeptide repeat protein [Chryseolinea sp.]
MPSLVAGYEYDIFISYRHKDNKGEHWVSEFVAALKTELESTFKEDVSIYFDENPHDGLLETHDVNKSLQDKLKCLIFIPIISQTYCDPKSYAWQHEFLTFNKMVTDRADSLGRDIKLKNGNVASRILPIRIHDLDLEDRQLLEGELGGVLRGVEFIYKSAGVNRPLRPNDDKATNINRTYYRDQTNKVANAVKEIVTGIRNNPKPNLNQEPTVLTTPSAARNGTSIRTKRNVIIALLTAVLSVVAYSIFQYSSARINGVSADGEKSIAVLPFKTIGPDNNDEYFSDGMTEEVINNLAKVGELKVMSHTSVEQYKSRDKNSKTIAAELGVSYLLEGSVMKSGNKFRISVQLIQPETGFHIWTNEYDKEMTDIFQMYSDISREVTDALRVVLTASERKNIESQEVVELNAYDFYLKAKSELMNYRVAGLVKGIPHAHKAIDLFNKAIEADPKFARAYTGLGVALYYTGDRAAFVEKKMLDSAKNLADKALSLDKNIDEAYFIQGLYYHQIGDDDKAVDLFNKALQINPNYVDAMMALGQIYTNFKDDFVQGLPLMEKAIQLGRGLELAENLRYAGLAFEFLGLYHKTREYYSTAARLDGDSTLLYSSLSWYARADGNYEEALKLASDAERLDTTAFFASDNKAWALTLLGRYEEALKERLRWKTAIAVLDIPVNQANRIGHLYWMLGDKKSAMKHFNLFIAFAEKSIREDMTTAREGFSVYDMAGIYAFLGDKEKAYRYLDKVNERKFIPAFIANLIKDDPMFESIRHEERFKKIQAEMQEKNKRERDRVLNWLQNQSLKTKLEPKL